MRRISKPSWKQCALLIILLSHAVFGSPTVPRPTSQSAVPFEEKSSRILSKSSHYVSNTASLREEDLFGVSLEKRVNRKKRFIYEALKQAKQAKLLALGSASSNAVKSIGKSLFKNVATLGVTAVIFNFLYQKINQVLDFKTRLLTNLEQKNREQNSQVGIYNDGGDSGAADVNTAGSSLSSTTENPPDRLPQFNPDKVSLQVPDAVFGPGFNIANGASQVLGTLVQNTALRIARLFEALRPLLRSSTMSTSKSNKRDTEFDSDNSNTAKSLQRSKKMKKSTAVNGTGISDKTPMKASFVAITRHE